MGDFEEKKPGFSEKAGLLKRKITHYHFSSNVSLIRIYLCLIEKGMRLILFAVGAFRDEMTY